MISLLRTAFTAADNQSGDIGRIACAVLIVTFCGLAIWDVCVQHRPFDMINFMTGGGGLLAAAAGALRLKASTEPPAPPAP